MIVLVTHAKGGVGASTLAHLLGYVTGYEVVNLDGDERRPVQKDDAQSAYLDARDKHENIILDRMVFGDDLDWILAQDSDHLIHLGPGNPPEAVHTIRVADFRTGKSTGVMNRFEYRGTERLVVPMDSGIIGVLPREIPLIAPGLDQKTLDVAHRLHRMISA